MATSTPNHGLYKYGGDDSPDLTKLGPSMDKIDLELRKNADNRGYYYEMTDAASSDWQQVLKDTFTVMPANKVCHFRLILAGAHRVGYGFRANSAYAVYTVMAYAPPFESRCVLYDGTWTFTTI